MKIGYIGSLATANYKTWVPIILNKNNPGSVA
jgi:hypothetical protein